MTVLPAFVVFIVALVVAALSTPIVSRIASAYGVIDRPNERKVSRRENIPLAGGLAVALGFFVAVAVALWLPHSESFRGHVEGLILGSIILLAIGVWDDRWDLRAMPKLVGQLAAAGLAVWFGFKFEYISEPVTGQTLWFPEWLVWVVTILWIVGITNAMNLLDGLDGLTSGVGVIIAATLTVICWQTESWSGVLLGVAFVGAILGFLPFNFPPARIFLGDTGAYFIGFGLSLLALEGYRNVSFLTFVVPLLALAVPLLDTGLSVLRRMRRRKQIFGADSQHIHHRLLESEGSVRSAVLSIYFLTLCFCVIAVSFTQLEGWVAIVFLGAVLLLTLRLLRNLGFFDVPEDQETIEEDDQGGRGAGEDAPSGGAGEDPPSGDEERSEGEDPRSKRKGGER